MANPDTSPSLWPTAVYQQQVATLRTWVGQMVYVVEIAAVEAGGGVHFPGQAVELLAVVDFPKPDPYRQLCPHLLVLGDGRGVNLGRVVRVTRNSAFSPAEADVGYCNQAFMDDVLFAPRRLSRGLLAATTRAALGVMLGKPTEPLLPRQD